MLTVLSMSFNFKSKSFTSSKITCSFNDSTSCSASVRLVIFGPKLNKISKGDELKFELYRFICLKVLNNLKQSIVY